MKLKDMTDLIRIYDAYKQLKRLDISYDLLDELRAIEDVIMRNSALYRRDCNDIYFDINECEHTDILNDKRLTAEQRAFRILGICNEA